MSFDPTHALTPLAVDEPTLPAVKRLLTRLHADLHQHVAALTDETTTEALHDFRVALRRTRTLLGRCRTAIPAPVIARFHTPLRDLARLSGARRDLDVLLAELTDAPQQEMLAPLRAWCLVQRRTEQEAIRRRLASGIDQQLLTDWAGWLQQSDSKAVSPPAADLPLATQANALVTEALHALRRGCATRAAQPAPAELHRLRILGKRLRYLLESFAPLFPSGDWGRLHRQLKELQDLLGHYQDGEAQLALLKTAAREPMPLRRAARLWRSAVRERQQRLHPQALSALDALCQPWVRALEQSLRPTPSRPSPTTNEVAMKQITLLRHAKAKKARSRGTDLGRRLRKRGMADALTLNHIVQNLDWPAPLVMTSPARRALETAHAVFAQPHTATGMVVADELYPGSGAALFELLRCTPDACRHIVLVGHHPALTELWNLLSGELCDKLPTCACYSLTFDIDNWNALTSGTGHLMLRHTPRAPVLTPPVAIPAKTLSQEQPAASAQRKPATKTKNSCRKGVSEADNRPGHFRCRKCKAISDRAERVCAPEPIPE